MEHYWSREDRRDVLDAAVGAKLILDVGAGCRPFPKATHVIDYLKRTSYIGLDFIQMDVCLERLPFGDKEVDFVYCAHTVEDVCNPEFLLREVRRVGKAGYFETPSALQEVCRRVDAGEPNWRGHHHHRSFVGFLNGEVTVIPKYPIVEHLDFGYDKYLPHSKYWNDYLLWEGDFGMSVLGHNVDYRINDSTYKQAIDSMIDNFIAKMGGGYASQARSLRQEGEAERESPEPACSL